PPPAPHSRLARRPSALLVLPADTLPRLFPRPQIRPQPESLFCASDYKTPLETPHLLIFTRMTRRDGWIFVPGLRAANRNDAYELDASAGAKRFKGARWPPPMPRFTGNRGLMLSLHFQSVRSHVVTSVTTPRAPGHRNPAHAAPQSVHGGAHART